VAGRVPEQQRWERSEDGLRLLLFDGKGNDVRYGEETWRLFLGFRRPRQKLLEDSLSDVAQVLKRRRSDCPGVACGSPGE
jgi:hypothetical protein